MDGANLVVCKEMLRVIRFVPDTQWFCLKMEPKKIEGDCNILAHSDIDWAGYSENRISITGFIFTCWKHLSVGGQRDRKASLCPAVKPNMWQYLRQ
jgi:hypothetical protein